MAFCGEGCSLTVGPAEQAANEIAHVLQEVDEVRSGGLSSYGYGYCLTAITAAIARYAPPHSAYARVAKQDPSFNPLFHSSFEETKISHLVGVLKSLQHDLQGGRLRTVGEIVRAEVFEDLLELADSLVDETAPHTKDAAANLAGPVLEEHLRKLAAKEELDIERSDGAAKKASALNDELFRMEAYPRAYHKQITAWLEIRNNAAHGRFENYSRDQVRLMINGVSAFIQQFPA